MKEKLQGEVVGCHYVSLSRRIVICRDSVSLIPWFLGYVFWVFPRAPPEEGAQTESVGVRRPAHRTLWAHIAHVLLA